MEEFPELNPGPDYMRGQQASFATNQTSHQVRTELKAVKSVDFENQISFFPNTWLLPLLLGNHGLRITTVSSLSICCLISVCQRHTN